METATIQEVETALQTQVQAVASDSIEETAIPRDGSETTASTDEDTAVVAPPQEGDTVVPAKVEETDESGQSAAGPETDDEAIPEDPFR